MVTHFILSSRTPLAQDSFINITRANISTSHYEVLRELEVPPGLPNTSLGGMILIAACVARLDSVYSVFMRQDSWYARLIFDAMEDMFRQSVTSASSKGEDVSEEGGIEREGRTDFMRVSKREDFHSASGVGLDGSMWKRVFISKIEERLVRDVQEQFRVELKQEETLIRDVLEQFRVDLEQESSWRRK